MPKNLLYPSLVAENPASFTLDPARQLGDLDIFHSRLNWPTESLYVAQESPIASDPEFQSYWSLAPGE